MNDIIKINPSDYGLEDSKASEISAMFKPMLAKMVDLEKEYNEVIKLELSDETCAKAKELRLQYVKTRTGTAKIHKELKQFYLQGGRFVDGWKNAQLMASQGIEDTLMNIEKHFEILEEKRIAELQETRSREVSRYSDDFDLMPNNLGEMPEDVWSKYLTGAKTLYEVRVEAERKVAEERIAKEKAEAKEREKFRIENELLKQEALEREKLARIQAI